MRHRARGPRSDRGSVLMLMPAAVLIVLVLSAIAVDLSIVQMGGRQAIDAADAAANDAVTYGISEAALRNGGGIQLDPVRVRASVQQTLDAQGITPRLATPPLVEITGPASVRITLSITIDYLFAKSLPGTPDQTTVTAVGEATGVQR